MDLQISGQEDAVRKVLEFVKPFIGNEIETVSMGESMFSSFDETEDEAPHVLETFGQDGKEETKPDIGSLLGDLDIGSVLANLDPEMMKSLAGALGPFMAGAIQKKAKKSTKKG